MTPPISPVPGAVEVLPELDVFPPERQRRWTVLLRLLLLIPQYIALFVVGVAVAVALVIAWFGALALGRLPAWCADFFTWYVVWVTQVESYAFLLVDTYPPFGSPNAYPVSVELAPGGPLNRAAVMFRLVLYLPTYFMLGFLSFGWGLLAFFFWLAVVILGRNPRPVYEATAAIVRYRMRANAYIMMLTPAYPKRLFGDREPAPPRSSTRPLLLSSGGRVLLIAIIVLGVLAQIGQQATSYRTGPPGDEYGYYHALDQRSASESGDRLIAGPISLVWGGAAPPSAP